MGSVPTTQLLTPEGQRIGRYVVAGLVVLLVFAAIVLDIRERRQEAEPLVIHDTVYIIATPTAAPTYQPPTEVPQVIGEVTDWVGHVTRITP